MAPTKSLHVRCGGLECQGGDWAEPRHGLQTLRRLGTTRKPPGSLAYTGRLFCSVSQKIKEFSAHAPRDRSFICVKNSVHTTAVPEACRNHKAEFIKNGALRI